MVGVPGFEPGTSSLSETRSNQLSYTPVRRSRSTSASNSKRVEYIYNNPSSNFFLYFYCKHRLSPDCREKNKKSNQKCIKIYEHISQKSPRASFLGYFICKWLCFEPIYDDVSFSYFVHIEIYFFYESVVDIFTWQSCWEHVWQYTSYFSLFLTEDDHAFCLAIEIIGVMEESTITLSVYVDSVVETSDFFWICLVHQKSWIL